MWGICANAGWENSSARFRPGLNTLRELLQLGLGIGSGQGKVGLVCVTSVDIHSFVCATHEGTDKGG